MQQLFSLSLSEVRFVSRRKARRDRGESVSHSARAHDMEAAFSVGVGAERVCSQRRAPIKTLVDFTRSFHPNGRRNPALQSPFGWDEGGPWRP